MKKLIYSLKNLSPLQDKMKMTYQLAFVVFAFLCSFQTLNAATNIVTSASMDTESDILPIYGSGSNADYRVYINTNSGNVSGTSNVFIAGTNLPFGCTYSFISGTLAVVGGNQVQLPAFSPGGYITLRITTRGNCLLNQTQAGTTAGIYVSLSSTPEFITTNNCSLIILKKNLGISGLTANSKIYDGTNIATYYGGTLTGVICSEVVLFTPSGTFSSSNVGENILIVTSYVLSGPDGHNYNLFNSNHLANITTKSVDVDIQNMSKCQGQSSVYSGDEFTASGFLNADGLSSLTMSCAGDNEFAVSGDYPVTGSNPIGTGLSNYTLSITNGTLSNYTLPTITTAIPSSRCGAGSLDLAATASAGTIDWFSNADGGASIGTGTSFATPNILETTPYWVETSLSGCTSERTQVLATIENCTKISAVDCGTTAVDIFELIYADAVSGATNYKFRFTAGATTFEYIRGSANRNFKFQSFGHIAGTAYTVSVSAFVGDSWTPYGASCIVNSPATTSLVYNGYCGKIYTSFDDLLVAYRMKNATDYKFEFTDGVNAALIYTRLANSTTMKLSSVSGIRAATTYNVRVSAKVGGSWISYGNSCTITTPATTQLRKALCGTNQALDNVLNIYVVPNATHYQYAAINGGTTLTFTKPNSYATVKMSDFPGVQLNTPYQVKVRAYVAGAYQAWGPPCQITTPAAMMEQEESDSYEANYDAEMSDINFDVFPNPSDGNFTISSIHEGSFNIINELGQLIQKVEMTKENKFQTKVENLRQGVYFVSGTINNEVITKKVVVQ